MRPPRPDHPLVDVDDRMFAHSERFVLPRRTAPASRSRRTTNASAGGFAPTSASDPAVVAMRSAVSMLSFTRIGMPWSGPRGPFSFRSRSRASAIARASGFFSRTLRSAGPPTSTASIRARYASVIERAVHFPDVMPA